MSNIRSFIHWLIQDWNYSYPVSRIEMTTKNSVFDKIPSLNLFSLSFKNGQYRENFIIPLSKPF